jgi:hypothetical protein
MLKQGKIEVKFNHKKIKTGAVKALVFLLLLWKGEGKKSI